MVNRSFFWMCESFGCVDFHREDTNYFHLCLKKNESFMSLDQYEGEYILTGFSFKKCCIVSADNISVFALYPFQSMKYVENKTSNRCAIN